MENMTETEKLLNTCVDQVIIDTYANMYSYKYKYIQKIICIIKTASVIQRETI